MEISLNKIRFAIKERTGSDPYEVSICGICGLSDHQTDEDGNCLNHHDHWIEPMDWPTGNQWTEGTWRLGEEQEAIDWIRNSPFVREICNQLRAAALSEALTNRSLSQTL